MRKPSNARRVTGFDALEDRVVMSASRAQVVTNDVTSFFSNYAATVPALVQTWEGLKATADSTGSASDIAAASTARANIDSTIKSEVNALGTKLWHDLGATMATYNQVRTLVTGATGSHTITTTTNTPSTGSLMATLLAVSKADANALGGQDGVNLAADLSVATSQSLAYGRAISTNAFGVFTSAFFTDVQTMAKQLQTDRAAVSSTPTMAQTAAVESDLSVLNNLAIRDVNGLATSLSNQFGNRSTQTIGTLITGVASGTTFPYTTTTMGTTTRLPNRVVSSVLFTPASGTTPESTTFQYFTTATPSYGSLLSTLLTLNNSAPALQDPNVIINVATLYALA